jgi:hypothetical protein
MSTVLDIFASQQFSARVLTEVINVVPNNINKIGGMGLFPVKPVPTTYVRLAYKEGEITILPVRERGAPSTKNTRRGPKFIHFDIPHIPHGDAIMALDIQNRIRLGEQGAFERAQDLVAEVLENMTTKHYRTLEHMRVGAIKGQIIDADGSVIYDLFDEFGITQKVVDFNLDNAGTDVSAKIVEVLRYMEDNLNGESMSGVRALCSREFFDAFIGHAKVKEAYDKYASAQEPLRQDVRKGFNHKGVVWEEYHDTFSYLQDDGSSTTRRAVASGDCHFVPLGTTATQTYTAPPDFLDAANIAPAAGKLMYAKQERMKFDKGIEIHTESNPLPIVKRPALLVKGTLT